VVKDHLPYLTPYWAHEHTPGCIRSLGLDLPCTEIEVKQAYRQLAESLHPDRGGDRQRFMLLQDEFEAAIQFLRDQE
jgi:DnaJ-class molecular chaperone